MPTLKCFLLFVTSYVCAFAQTGTSPIGIFEGETDVGHVLHPGASEFDEAGKTYTLTGSGENMWAAEDDFHFVWKKVTGDVTLTAAISFPTSSGNAHKKGVLMVRRSLDQDSDYVDAALHLAGLTSLQSRDQKGSSTREVQAYLSGPKLLRLEKRGDYFFLFVAGEDRVFHLAGGSMKLSLTEPFYVGIGACAHDKDAVEKVSFSGVELVSGPAAAGKPVLYSSLEVTPVQSTDRRTVYVAQGRIGSPNWSKDAVSLIFDVNGGLQKVPAAGGKPEPLNTGKLARNNAHHGVSPDGATLAVTDESKHKPVVYTLPVNGGNPTQITKRTPSEWHAWSPDGKSLLFTSKRGSKEGIFTIPAAGGAETAIAAGAGVSRNPVYSPDGKYIYFDSNRGGATQIWRMLADGTGQEQVTADGVANWLPHVSPDGKQVAFLSSDTNPETEADGKELKLSDMKIRSMLLATHAARVIANIVGGSGTFDAQPWSPDSRSLSYVSYQMVPE